MDRLIQEMEETKKIKSTPVSNVTAKILKAAANDRGSSWYIYKAQRRCLQSYIQVSKASLKDKTATKLLKMFMSKNSSRTEEWNPKSWSCKEKNISDEIVNGIMVRQNAEIVEQKDIYDEIANTALETITAVIVQQHGTNNKRVTTHHDGLPQTRRRETI
ncbi:hypothetical protein HELRODRAFT_163004 [Helobdella robusta]|uniref:Uncharacterized protein n=1 Tax=Helobdella robusta TaxID=6412 RepID=T1ETJ6_HELRO|nr:hypothetical protein HELRODRAFT_163004 [Helobdella robusta]ESN99455.1 hypothetical protein HELRODRAFT_163004 [Helobdella robusta]